MNFSERYKDKKLSEIKREMSFIKENVMVIWLEESKLGTNIHDVFDKILKNKCSEVLIIADERTTSHVHLYINELKNTTRINITVWTLNETVIFAPDHELVPKHEICSEEEYRNVLSDYGISPKQLPKINHEDVISRYLLTTFEVHVNSPLLYFDISLILNLSYLIRGFRKLIQSSSFFAFL